MPFIDVRKEIRAIEMYKKSEKAKIKIIISVLCMTLIFGAFATSCSSGTDSEQGSAGETVTINVLKIAADVKKGEKMTSDKVETVAMDAANVWAGAITDVTKVFGKYALTDMAAGDFIFGKNLSDTEPEVDEEVVLDNYNLGFKDLGYIVVTEFLKANTGEDLAPKIQEIIERNPQKVIYFPDGEYIIGSPIYTPGNGVRSVALKLSDNAVIKASDDWKRSDEAMIRMGGILSDSNGGTPGSDYYIEGGTIDGNGIADGISIDGGLHTAVKNLNVINTEIGVHIKNGVNSGSADTNIEHVNIVGNMSPSSVGVLVTALDNTIWNVRISNVQTGVKLTKGGNFMRDVHVTYTGGESMKSSYSTSYGFYDMYDRNWYESCSSTDFAIAYNIAKSRTVMTSCVARWTEAQSDAEMQVAISTSRALPGIVRSLAAYYTAPADRCEYLVTATGGSGVIQDPIFDVNAVNSDSYREYLIGKVHWQS